MTPLILSLGYDKPGKVDASKVFLPAADDFARRWGGHVVAIDNRPPLADRLAPSIAAVDAAPWGFDVLAYFGHGWHDGIALGVTRANVRVFARHVVARASPALTVLLFACGTAEGEGEEGGRTPAHADVPGAGDGGFADVLRDTLNDLGCRATVYAHASLGHATANPYVRRFVPGIRAGGAYVVPPDSPLWHAWTHGLAGPSELWARFAFMSDAQLRAELSP